MAKNPAVAINANGSLHHLPLKSLHLDYQNPRFGGRHLTKESEPNVVDEIIGQHGIQDVLSSIATNDYFESEPLVGAIHKGFGEEVTVVEGNRRLTACLVLAGDKRAKGHERLRSQFANSSRITADTLLPVQVYDWSDKKQRARLLPYLGVRHIVGAQQWDSYAKAAWVVHVLEGSEMSMRDIKAMIGDDQSFTDRIVEGYYFVGQLTETNTYDPAQSLRRGRGSHPEYPFSWVYTALGYKGIREFVGLPRDAVLKEDPIDESLLEKAGTLMELMFGGDGKNAAISDSREIGSLAKALNHEEAVAVLARGGTLSDAVDAMRPPDVLLLELLKRADRSLGTATSIAAGLRSVSSDAFASIVDTASKLEQRIDNLADLIAKIGRPSTRRKKGERE